MSLVHRIVQAVLNREARIPKRKPEKVIAALQLHHGDTVVDIGSGGGYFSLRFAELVGPDGLVTAIDPNPGLLDQLTRAAERKGHHTIRTVQTTTAPDLPAGTVDLVFVRDAYHHLRDHAAYFRRLRPALKPHGRIAVIDYRRYGLAQRLFPHFTEPARIRADLAQAGYRLAESHDFLLPEQSFQVFTVNTAHGTLRNDDYRRLRHYH